MSKFKSGDKVRVVSAEKKTYWYADLIGKEFTLDHNSNSFGWTIKGYSGSFLRESDIIKVSVSPEDEVTITTTYGELARVFAIMGNVNGRDYGYSLWATALDKLSESFNLDEDELRVIWDDRFGYCENIDYCSHQEEWIRALFGEQESEEEKAKALKIKELEESINNAKKQLEELKSLK